MIAFHPAFQYDPLAFLHIGRFAVVIHNPDAVTQRIHSCKAEVVGVLHRIILKWLLFINPGYQVNEPTFFLPRGSNGLVSGKVPGIADQHHDRQRNAYQYYHVHFFHFSSFVAAKIAKFVTPCKR